MSATSQLTPRLIVVLLREANATYHQEPQLLPSVGSIKIKTLCCPDMLPDV